MDSCGTMLKNLNTRNSNLMKISKVRRKAGSKLKNAVGARPNPTNDGTRTKGTAPKTGKRRAAYLD